MDHFIWDSSRLISVLMTDFLVVLIGGNLFEFLTILLAYISAGAYSYEGISK